MGPLRILGIVIALPIVALSVGGFRLGAGLALPELLWTLLGVAALLAAAQAFTVAPRRRIQALVPWPTLAVAVSLLVNGLVCWGALVAADAGGLAVSVSGYLPALCASLIIPVVVGLTVTSVRGLVGQIQAGRRSLSDGSG